MCGRYIANSEEEIMEIREILKQISVRLGRITKDIKPETSLKQPETSLEQPETSLEFPEAPLALSEIFPTDNVLMINREAEFKRAKWGLEKWDKKSVIINAKSETYEQSGFFKPFAENRCIIPAHGYYEWQTLQDKTKIKHAFTSGQKHGIFMAGIYNKNSEFAIITKPADPETKFIHPRMPLIIKAEQAEAWLGGELKIRELLA